MKNFFLLLLIPAFIGIFAGHEKRTKSFTLLTRPITSTYNHPSDGVDATGTGLLVKDFSGKSELCDGNFLDKGRANAYTGDQTFPIKEGKLIRFAHNASPKGADLDVSDYNGRLLFRILMPESITAKNVPDRSLLNHIMPGEWGETDGIYWGKLVNNDWIEGTLAFMPRKQGALILFGIRNLTNQPLEGVAMDVCVGVSHLPCPNGAWINPHFVSVPEPFNRDSAGRYWYEKVAPYRLKAFINGQWIIAHPHPQQPSSIGVPSYMPFVYLDSPAYVMAAESIDGKERLFEAWDSPCKVRCAFPGNSCMHLEPLLSKKLIPGQISYIRGEISVTNASWEAISKWNAEQFRHEYDGMRKVLDRL